MSASSLSLTVNSFPSLHSLSSPRSWFMAVIVLLHVGFFYALSSGLSQQILTKVLPPTIALFPEDVRPEPPPKQLPVDQPIEPSRYDRLVVPEPPPIDYQDRGDVIEARVDPHPYVPPIVKDEPRGAVIVEPGIDPRRGLTEPMYPPTSIRLNETGTVLLSVQVRQDGRVGDVRIDQSSGHSRLDDAAIREARRWKFIPGSQDGVPMVMWKQIPITFKLQEGR